MQRDNPPTSDAPSAYPLKFYAGFCSDKFLNLMTVVHECARMACVCWSWFTRAWLFVRSRPACGIRPSQK